MAVRLRDALVAVLCFSMFATTARAQSAQGTALAAEMESRYAFTPDVPYMTENGVEMKLDIYNRRDVQTPQPTVIFMHGGFWVAGNKNAQTLNVMPWLFKGYNVVVVGYRLGGVAPAPAALVDSFCALRFIGTNAAKYNIDTNKIVASGMSAGGHLALSLGMMADQGFDKGCPAGTTPKVAAVVNWYGVTDVTDSIAGPHKSDAARSWFGKMTDADALALAKTLSPINYVRNGLPPILTIQGDADKAVPYEQGIALDKALAGTTVKHAHLTIPGGGHGRFTAEERKKIYATIDAFLHSNGIE